jgi:hypothetical protein
LNKITTAETIAITAKYLLRPLLMLLLLNILFILIPLVCLILVLNILSEIIILKQLCWSFVWPWKQAKHWHHLHFTFQRAFCVYRAQRIGFTKQIRIVNCKLS